MKETFIGAYPDLLNERVRVAPSERPGSQNVRIRGAVAQLVAHLHGMQGVRGSSPLSSTRYEEPMTARSSALRVSRYGFAMISRLAWVTAHEARGHDEDEPEALSALRAAGATVDVLSWDDPSAPWDTYERAVLRSPWDYAQRLPEFLAWLEATSARTQVVNHPSMVRWSLDKQYLAELEAAGVPITPTQFVAPGDTPAYPAGACVVKPSVGAGSRDAAWYSAQQHELAAAHIARLHAVGQVVLVQPRIDSVATDGEWPLLFFAGEFSHAASKRVALPQARQVDGLFAPESSTPHAATPEQIAVATQAIEYVTGKFGAPTYARVDLVRDEDGSYLVLEVELAEPSLFLPQGGPQAAQRMAQAFLA